MCFSAEASFIGGAVISTVGVATLKMEKQPSRLLFAAIPLIFGFQQISEGFLWLSLNTPETSLLKSISAHSFLLIAEVLWPIILPLSILLLEQDQAKKPWLQLLLALGTGVALYYLHRMVSTELSPEIVGHHIKYHFIQKSAITYITVSAYILATIAPLFICSEKRMNWLGLLMFTSCALTAIFYIQQLTSVWCFFAAIISGIIYWITKKNSHIAKTSTKL